MLRVFGGQTGDDGAGGVVCLAWLMYILEGYRN
jgi:hypothetical protein